MSTPAQILAQRVQQKAAEAITSPIVGMLPMGGGSASSGQAQGQGGGAPPGMPARPPGSNGLPGVPPPPAPSNPALLSAPPMATPFAPPGYGYGHGAGLPVQALYQERDHAYNHGAEVGYAQARQHYETRRWFEQQLAGAQAQQAPMSSREIILLIFGLAVTVLPTVLALVADRRRAD